MVVVDDGHYGEDAFGDAHHGVVVGVCDGDGTSDVVDVGDVVDFGNSGDVGDVGDVGNVGDVGDNGDVGDVGDAGKVGDVHHGHHEDDAVDDAHHGVVVDVATGSDCIHPDLGVPEPGGIIVLIIVS